MKRLNESNELKAYTSQFVTIKMATGNREFSEFHNQFKGSYSGSIRIPFVYIVRSDGQTMYAGSGAKDVAEMGQLLHGALANNGTLLNENQVLKLIDAKETMTEMREEGDIAGAISQLRKLGRIGKPGEIASYAQPAIELNQMVADLIEEGQTKLEPVAVAVKEFAADSTQQDEAATIDLINQVMDVENQYGGLKALKNGFAKVSRTLRGIEGVRDLQKGLETIQKSKKAKSKSAIGSAIEKVQAIVDERKAGALVDQATEAIEDLKVRLAEAKR